MPVPHSEPDRSEPEGVAHRTAQVAFDELLREHVRPALSAVGFRRTRGTFHRAAGQNWEAIDFQRSHYSDRQEVKFTVNLGVGFEALRAVDDAWPAGKRPAEFRCHLRERIGTAAYGCDHWWDLRPSDALEPIAAEVLGLLESTGLPWLKARSHETRWRDTCLASLGSVSSRELPPLQKLVGLIGPREAVDRVAAERARRP